MSAAKIVAAALSAILATAADPGPAQAEQKVEKVDLDDVWSSPNGEERITELYIRARTRLDEIVEDLHAPDFEITDAGVRIGSNAAEVATLEELGRGITCVIAIDVSETMRGAPFERAKAAAQELIEFVDPRDRVATVAFASEARVIIRFDTEGENAREALEALTIDSTSLNTVLYDGVDQALGLIRAGGQELPRRSFIIVFSDGKDSGSQHSIEQVIDDARGTQTEQPVLIYTIGYSRLGGEGFDYLAQLSEQTNADFLPTKSAAVLRSFFNGIWDQMMKSYIVRYPATMDGELHEIEVKIGEYSSTRTVLYQFIRPEWHYGSGLVLLLVVLLAVILLWIRNIGSVGRLIFENGPQPSEAVVIRKRHTSIGALEENDIVIPVNTVSKRHVVIHRRGRNLEIEDLNSVNGTFVNGVRVRTSLLQPGDRIRIADIDMVYQR